MVVRGITLPNTACSRFPGHDLTAVPPRCWRRLLQTMLFAAVAWSSANASAQSCIFTTGAGTAAFPALDPSAVATRTAFTTVRIFCLPLAFTPTWQFAGANGNVPLRMKHDTQTAYISYTVAPSFTGFSGFSQNWRITATVLGQDYVNAYLGSYSDLLTATILP